MNINGEFLFKIIYETVFIQTIKTTRLQDNSEGNYY